MHILIRHFIVLCPVMLCMVAHNLARKPFLRFASFNKSLIVNIREIYITL